MKTAPRTEATRSILAFITEHQPVAHQVLLDHFGKRAEAEGTTPGKWLHSRMNNLRESGYIAHGASGWTASTEEELAQRVTPHQARRRRKPKEERSVDVDNVAQPRRISMFGPTYVPPAQVHRAGALDYAAAPSLINGRPTAYRRGW